MIDAGECEPLLYGLQRYLRRVQYIIDGRVDVWTVETPTGAAVIGTSRQQKKRRGK